MTFPGFHPLAAVAERRIEAAAESMRPRLMARLDDVRGSVLALKADRDATGRWDIEAVLKAMDDLLAAGRDMAAGMMAAGWPVLSQMVLPMVRPTVQAHLRRVIENRAEEAIAEWCGGWSPGRIRKMLADCDAYDAETAAQTDALLADIFNEEPNHAAH